MRERVPILSCFESYVLLENDNGTVLPKISEYIYYKLNSKYIFIFINSNDNQYIGREL